MSLDSRNKADAQHCPVDGELHRFLDNDLTETERLVVDQHVEQCDRCQGMLESFTTEIALSHSNAFELPAAIAARLKTIGIQPVDSENEKIDRDITSVPEVVGEYRIISRLGSGGMGTVFLAEHQRLKRQVAFKVLNQTDDPRLQARFLREMSVAGQLEHPNIVRTTDAGELDGICFIAMEVLEGIEVRRLAKDIALSVADACEIIRQAALGLHHAHECGLIHRDIKPANLIVTPDGVVKVLDLGLARSRERVVDDEITVHGEVTGTIDYMSPEQCRDPNQIGPQSDVYSLGATLYRLLTGRSQLDGCDSLISKLTALATDESISIVDMRSDLPKGLADLVDEMLLRDPTTRIQSAAYVAEKLEPFCQDAALDKLLDNPMLSRSEVSTGTFANALTSTPSVETELPQTQHVSANRTRGPWTVVAMGAFSAAVLFAIIYVQLGDSVLKIDVRSPDLTVRVDDSEVKIMGLDQPVTLRPGKHKIKVQRGDFKFQTDDITLSWRETEVLIVQLLKGRIEVLRDGKLIDSHQLPAGDRSLLDKPVGEQPVARAQSTATTDRDVQTTEPLGTVSNENDRKFVSQLRRWREQLGWEIHAALEPMKTIEHEFGPSWGANCGVLPGVEETLPPDHCVAAIRIITSKGGQVPKEIANHISALPRLKHIRVVSSPPNLLTHLGEIPSLSELYLTNIGSGFTDDSIVALQKFPALQMLYLGGTELSVEGVEHLARVAGTHLPRLETLETGGLSDRALKSISTIQSLTRVEVPKYDSTDAGVGFLTVLPLEFLKLYGNPVTDTCMDHVLQMKGLTVFDVRGTRITANGLLRLQVLPKLTKIDARGLSYTTDELRKLRTAMPNVEILATLK